MPVRILREEQVNALVDIEDALKAVEAAFVEQAQGTGVNSARRRVRQPNGALHLMGGALVRRGYWGFKAYTTTRNGVRFNIQLYDANSGELVSLMEADRLGQLRTGAASGVATSYLARQDAHVLALIGAGHQAETQLTAIASVRKLEAVRVYSRSEEKRELFAHRMGDRLGVEMIPVHTPGEALLGADIVTTITTAREPVFDGNDVGPGTHINAAGSNASIRVELDATTIRRADRIFVDDPVQVRFECGDLIHAYERNALNWGRVRPLADVVAGLTVGRKNLDEVTLFESQGIALWDLALAADVYDRALDEGIGELVDFGE
jgi:ornithine cyclodeaminase/alanine dehydrogenase